MPTLKTREIFLRQAVRYWQRQSYPSKDLIVVGDYGARPDLPKEVVYVDAPTDASIGHKLNLGCAQAKGSLIQKLDDDDYYHPAFMDQMAREARDHPMFICGPAAFLMLLCKAGRLINSGPDFYAGVILFPIEVWQNGGFNEKIRVGEDKQFMRDHEMIPRLTVPNNPEMYMVVRHSYGHAWRRHYGAVVEDFFMKKPDHRQTLREYIKDEQDIRFYEDLIEFSKTKST